MLENIGTTAGNIWNYLSINNEQTTVANLRKKLDLKPEPAALALGWLAREGKLCMTKSGNSIKVLLKD